MNYTFEVQFIDWEGTENTRNFPTLEEAEEFQTSLLLEAIVLHEEDVIITKVRE